MYEHIDKQLSQSLQDISRLKKIEAMLETLKAELQAVEEKSQTSKAKLEKEKKDYEKITQKSFSSIFYAVLGNLEKKREKEQQEVLEAVLKCSQYVRDLEDIKTQISKLETEKKQYKNAPAKYDKFYNEKLHILLIENKRTAREIMKLSQDIELSKNNQRETCEAINVGQEVEASLSEALKNLNSAQGWGVWDMLGGGLIADIIKHSHINTARDAAQRTQLLLRRFHTELADVRILKDIQINISGFATFADFFFDGLIADWFMQSKINATQESVRAARNQVQSVICKLSKLKDAEQKAQNDLNTQISGLVIGPGLKLTGPVYSGLLLN